MQNKNTWPISKPDKLNMDHAQIENLGRAVKKSKVKSCLILKKGKLVYQYYKSNKNYLIR